MLTSATMINNANHICIVTCSRNKKVNDDNNVTLTLVRDIHMDKDRSILLKKFILVSHRYTERRNESRKF